MSDGRTLSDRRSTMYKRTASSDRRGGLRYWRMVRMGWRKRSSDVLHRGWLNDESDSGVSFVTGTAAQPSLGEEVEIVGLDRLPRRHRVVRIAPCGDRGCVIACRARTDERPPPGEDRDAQSDEEATAGCREDRT
jgi:hypothetical protein